MNLFQVRQILRSLSGRYDLVDDNTELADFFINQGCRFLDRYTEVQKTWSSHFQYLAIGGWNVQFPYCRAVKEVWVATTSARWQLEKKNLQDILTEYMTEIASLVDTGESSYYSPAITRYVPEGAALPVGISNYTDVITSTGQAYNAIIIAPPTDTQILVEVKGFFYSRELVTETDENFWTAVHPNLLVKAALREIEVYNQSPTNVKAWEEAINVDMDSLNKDTVEEIIAEVDQMEG